MKNARVQETNERAQEKKRGNGISKTNGIIFENRRKLHLIVSLCFISSRRANRRAVLSEMDQM